MRFCEFIEFLAYVMCFLEWQGLIYCISVEKAEKVVAVGCTSVLKGMQSLFIFCSYIKEYNFM